MQHTEDLGEARNARRRESVEIVLGGTTKVFSWRKIFGARKRKEDEKNPRGFVLYIDACQHKLARAAWILLCTEHVAIPRVPYELPDQNSSPNIPPGVPR